MESGYKSVNGIRLYYERYGAGQPVVLLHGGGGSIRHDFAELIRRMDGDFELIGIDLQNHGRSEHREEPETFEQDARDVAGMMDQLGLSKAFLVGFSNGGTTAMLVAHLFPKKVEGMVIASGLYQRKGMPEGFFEGLSHATVSDMPLSLQENFLSLNPDRALLEHMFDQDRQRMVNFRDFDSRLLRSINVPAFFIAGDRDIVQTTHTVEMADLIGGGRLLILPAGHGGYLMADIDGFVDKSLIDFTVSQIVKFFNSVK